MTRIKTPVLADITSSDFEIKTFSSTEEWAKARPNYVGASAVGAILGLSKYDSKLSIYAKSVGLMERSASTCYTERGHRLEPVVAADFAKMTGAIIMEDSAQDFIVVDKMHPWRGVSPDRFAWPAGTEEKDMTAENLILIECKTCSLRDGGYYFHVTPETILTKHPEYMFQCQYQMAVCRVKQCALAFMDCTIPESLPTQYLMIQYNEDLANVALNAVDDLYLNHIVPQIPPEEIMLPKDTVIKYPVGRATNIKVTKEILKLIEMYSSITKQESELKEQKESIKNSITDFMGTNDTIVDDKTATRLATWKAGKPRFDEAKFKKENETLYNSYCTKSVDRSFRLVQTRKTTE